MATTKEFAAYALDQFRLAEEITSRQMMGEYLLYCRGRLFGGLCDNRLMVKDIPAARELLPGAALEPPYPGAKPMLVVEAVDDAEFLSRLTRAMYPHLPEPKPKKEKRS